MIDFDTLTQSLGESAIYFQKHPYSGLIMAFSFAFIESLAIIGSLIPGIILMSYIGYLMGTAVLSLKLGLITVILGAFSGDYLSYLIGKRYRPAIMKTKFYQNNLKTWEYGEHLLKKNGVLGMTLGRIIGPVRSTIPLIAGLINMPMQTFFLGATGSVLVWTLCYLSPSILLTTFGADLNINLSKQLLSSLIQGVVHLAITLIFIKLFISFHKKHNVIKQTINLCAALTYIIILLHTNSDVLILNEIILTITQNLHSPFGLFASSFLSISADKYTLYGFCFITTFILIITKQYQQAFIFSTATFGVGFAIKFVKIITNYPRPDLMLHLLGPTAFPSGHTGLYATTAFAICHMLSDHYPEKKSIFWFLGILSTCLIMLSRLYLGAHWLTDVIGGLIIGQLFYLIPYQWLMPRMNAALVLKQTANQIGYLFLMACILIPMLRLNIPSLTYHYNPKLYQIDNPSLIYNSHAVSEKTPDSIRYAHNILGVPLYPLDIQAQLPLSEWMKKLQSEWQVDHHPDMPFLTVLGSQPTVILEHQSLKGHYMILWSFDHIMEHNSPLIVGFMLKILNNTPQIIDAEPYLKNAKFQIEHHKQRPIYTQLQGWNGNIYKIEPETI